MKPKEPKKTKSKTWSHPLLSWMEPPIIYEPGYNWNHTSKGLGILSICLFWTGPIGLIIGSFGHHKRMEGNNPRRDHWLNIIGIMLSLRVTMNIFTYFFLQ